MQFPSMERPAIIALKGLPRTSKFHLASRIAKWARSPLLSIDDFLSTKEDENGINITPTRDEAHHLIRRAFDLLCSVAKRQVGENNVNCIVIKSRLSTTSELDRLIDLMIKSKPHRILIIECRLSNEYEWKSCFNWIHLEKKRWNKAKSWNDVEKAKEEYDAEAWDRHFEHSLSKLPYHKQLVKRLKLDISASPNLPFVEWHVGNPFAEAIRYLLSKDDVYQLPNTMEFDELRQNLLERELNTPREKSKYLCRDERGCVFKSGEALEGGSCCGVCEKPIFGPVYTCYFCTLVLHKSCAEEPQIANTSKATLYKDNIDMWQRYVSENDRYGFNEEHACDFCKESAQSFSYECKSCLFQTHLKCRLMPTIVNHACHLKHFLSICLIPAVKWSTFDVSSCRGCYTSCYYNGYVCVTCDYTYHIRCLVSPREVKHEHGGYEHVMELMYSYDGMEEQEDFWCDVCYKDINPAEWFYRCKECLYYVSHMEWDNCLPCEQN